MTWSDAIDADKFNAAFDKAWQAMPPEEWLESNFERVWKYISPAVDRTKGAFDKASVWQLIQEQKAQLWPGKKSAAITEISTTPTGRKSMTIWLAGGDLDELMNAIEPKLCEWGKKQGCSHVEIIGRAGWVRTLKDYNEVARVVAKEL